MGKFAQNSGVQDGEMWSPQVKRARQVKPPLDTKGMVSRREAAALLGITISGLRYLEGVSLTPINLGNQRVYYERAEVERLRLDRSGEFASKAFAIFRDGGSAVDAVIALGLEPGHADHLWQLYIKMRLKARNCVLIEFPDAVHTEAWKRTFQLPELRPEVVKLLLEHGAMNPTTREAIRQFVDAPSVP
jgi:hypothetical protein